jgi:hypothetical protein
LQSFGRWQYLQRKTPRYGREIFLVEGDQQIGPTVDGGFSNKCRLRMATFSSPV